MTTAKRNLILFILSAIVAVLLGFVFISPDTAERRVISLGYWFTLGLFGFLAWSLINLFVQERRWQISRDTTIALILCLVAAVFLFTREPPRFKILMDEANIASTSLSLGEYKAADMRETPYESKYPLGLLDKRPLMFPFLASIAHDITGYRTQNAFYLNGVFTFLLLFTSYCLAKRITKSHYVALLAPLLICSFPLFAQNASGGGLEMLNCLLIAIATLFALDFTKNPSSTRLNALLLTTGALAWTRQESPLFIIATATVIIAVCLQQKKLITSKAAIALPLLLLPIPWLQVYTSSIDSFMELKAGQDALFSFSYFYENFASAIYFFQSSDLAIPNNPIASFIGIAALLIVIVLSLLSISKKYPLVSQNWAALLFLVFVVCHFALIQFFNWGSIASLEVSRLAMPLLFASAIAFSVCVYLFAKKAPKLASAPAILALASLFLILPKLNTAAYTRTNLDVNRFEWALDKVHTLSERPLVISNQPRLWTASEVPCISMRRAIHSLEQFEELLSKEAYSDIYVIQHNIIGKIEERIAPIPLSGNTMGPAIVTTGVAQSSFRFGHSTSIQRIDSIDKFEIAKQGGIDKYKSNLLKQRSITFAPQHPNLFTAWEASLP